ncbi:MAG: RagB/SusD family nutrient uptake outer membrane protein [Bacteroidales bacterium]|nr:RagB/SusD family nutrient uptake outer membrane protein [Bacteroidales bacterium]
MKTVNKTGILIGVLAFFSACDFLDVVPDNTLKLENIFSVKDEAWSALAKVYSYMPHDATIHDTEYWLGDEYVTHASSENTSSSYRSNRIMRGLQSATSPLVGYWSGSNGATPLYQGIRSANIFLEYIDRVMDMTFQEKAEWSAQVKFLKAYYTFLLVLHYGPVVIADKAVAPDAMGEEFYQKRDKVEDCFDFILRLIEEAIPDLNERQNSLDFGQIDRVGAMAIKARILLYRASPFFNGNSEYFGDFFDHDGEHFFSQKADAEKWKTAFDAIDAAIQIANRNLKGLYTYEDSPYIYDRNDWEADQDKMKTFYNLRMLLVDKWNRELLWGLSSLPAMTSSLSADMNIRLPEGYEGGGVPLNYTGSQQRVGASYAMAERYYTKNGLPIDEDLTFDKSEMYNIITMPDVSASEYDPRYSGLLQAGAQTVRLYLDREPRFYAHLGLSGGYWRAHSARIRTTFFRNGVGGNDGSTSNWIVTGIGVQKLVHPESTSGSAARIVKFPFPVIRLADLYLMRAEARNEYYGPSEEVYEDINLIRRRAGIPDLETVWEDPTLARNVNDHKDREKLRNIILYERSVELAFEGLRFWDMLRWKKAPSEFSNSVMGWNHRGANAETFFILQPAQYRKFTVKDCLWPIPVNEMNINNQLIQNPGW